MKKQENTKRKLFEMVNKLEPSFKLNEEVVSEEISRDLKDALATSIDEILADSDYTIGNSPRDIQGVVNDLLSDGRYGHNYNVDENELHQFVQQYLDDVAKSTSDYGSARDQGGPRSEKLQKYIYAASFLGDDMTEEQATKLMDDAKQELSIEEIQILMQNVGGAFYGELSQYNAEMGGLGRYE